MLMLSVVSWAKASSFSWYQNGVGGTSCFRQAVTSPAGALATPAANSEACIPVNLPSHSVGGDNSQCGIGADVGTERPNCDQPNRLTEGDWCNAYGMSDGLGPDAYNEDAYTEFTPGLSPVEQYQLGDHAGNVCSSDGGTSGQAFTTNIPGSICDGKTVPCGVHHYASTWNPPGSSVELNDRPWNRWFNSPSLTVSTSVRVVAFKGSGWGWGYLCPILEEMYSKFTIEYCFEEWKYNFSHAGEILCGTGAGNNDQIVVPMADSEYATGSFGFEYKGAKGWTAMSAQVSAGDLETAASKIDHDVDCAHNMSGYPANYQLIGVEQGTEGQGTELYAGGSTKDYSSAPATAVVAHQRIAAHLQFPSRSSVKQTRRTPAHGQTARLSMTINGTFATAVAARAAQYRARPQRPIRRVRVSWATR
jgi:hypothetical protein